MAGRVFVRPRKATYPPVHDGGEVNPLRRLRRFSLSRGVRRRAMGCLPAVLGSGTLEVRHRLLSGPLSTMAGPCVLNGPFLVTFRACFGPLSTKVGETCKTDHFHMPRTPVKTQVGPPLGLSRRRAEGRACISGPGTPNRNRRPAEGAQSVGSFRSADTGLPAGPHFA